MGEILIYILIGIIWAAIMVIMNQRRLEDAQDQGKIQNIIPYQIGTYFSNFFFWPVGMGFFIYRKWRGQL